MAAPDYRDQAARLAVLQYLNGQPAYTGPGPVIRQTLAAGGLVISADALRGHLAWLAEQGLVLTGGGETVAVATLTERGGDVATGAVNYPGVARVLPA